MSGTLTWEGSMAPVSDLMIEYGVGVQVEGTYRVVEIDEDFFT